uniref:Protein kinase domain-containing protein n=1 Tax=Kalanchoe fedtschenkoi TaxID=63787 RepID=A0A7N0UBS2_KALFE
MEQPEKKFPVNASAYQLYEEVGEGVSATVYRALCVPLNEIVAIKVLDLEKCNNDLDRIRREVLTMTLINHPNLLRAHCSFTTDHSLWVVMPYMAAGSCLHIMKSAYPDGFEEPVIATLLRETLKAIAYLHAHGLIHRDIKAGNILVDSDGAVKLTDFGVSASMFDTGDRQRSRNTFVGTPCWMAPEVMQQLHGYDFKADIWSFGITALELAHGHAPFSKYPPMKVLLMTLQNAPPGLDYERDKRFSKSFRELVSICLVKDPKKRPTSEKLLKHQFFKQARPNEYLARTILAGLSPLGDRFRTLKQKESDFLAQNKDQYGNEEQLSQQVYIRGISAWNFNLEDLKNQAAMIEDCESLSNVEESESNKYQKEKFYSTELSDETLSPERSNPLNDVPSDEEGTDEIHEMEDPLASFPIKPLEALKGYFDVSKDDFHETSTNEDPVQPEGKQQIQENQDVKVSDVKVSRTSSLPRLAVAEPEKYFSGSLVQQNVPSPKKAVNTKREYSQPRFQSDRNYSGPLLNRQKNSLSADDATEGPGVQHKGRFKITSGDVALKGPNTSNLSGGGSNGPTNSSVLSAAVSSSLLHLLQLNATQKEEIIKLSKYVEQMSAKHAENPEAGFSELSQPSSISTREKELMSQVTQLQQSIGSIKEELQKQKLRNMQLERQLKYLGSRENEETATEKAPNS